MGTYVDMNIEDLWYYNRLLASADGSPPPKKMTASMLVRDEKLACARVGWIIICNGGMVACGTHLTRKPVAGAPSAEIHALHFLSRKIRVTMKLLSYFADSGRATQPRGRRACRNR
jgi:hypothetical protein